MVPWLPAFISGIGVWEILVILVVALVVFGPRLPQVARTVGKGYMEFKRGLRTLEGQIEFGDIDVEVSDSRRGGRGESVEKAVSVKESDAGGASGPSLPDEETSAGEASPEREGK